MSFFDVPSPPEMPPPDEPARPPWFGPPRGVLPGMSTQRAVVFKTDRVFLIAQRFLSYPNGVEFTLTLRLRYREDAQRDLPFQFSGPRHPGPWSDEYLRLGVLLSDGTKWTNLTDWRPDKGGPPVVKSLGGHGGENSFDMQHWIWPLPPEGSLTLVSEWPAFDVPETHVVLDATELRARAAEAEIIWAE